VFIYFFTKYITILILIYMYRLDLWMKTFTCTLLKVLAEIFQDLLANKEDYLRAVRGLLREIVRGLRHDIHLPAFCLSLMQERVESKFTDLDSALKV